MGLTHDKIFITLNPITKILSRRFDKNNRGINPPKNNEFDQRNQKFNRPVIKIGSP
jgi:protein involved in sex pheromone biosynthesis